MNATPNLSSVVPRQPSQRALFDRYFSHFANFEPTLNDSKISVVRGPLSNVASLFEIKDSGQGSFLSRNKLVHCKINQPFRI